MARLQTFAKDIQLATAGISPQNIAAELAKFAQSELAQSIANGEGSPLYDRYVNGVKDAPESAVVAPGPILYDFIWWQEVVEFALQFLVERSPIRSGRYKRSWIVMADGSPVSDPSKIPIDAEVIITNDQPYSRKIDVGHMKMSVPPFVIEDARQAIMRIFGNMLTAKRTLIDLPDAYILKGYFRKGIRPRARTKLRKDTMAGAKMTYPALVLTMRTA